MACQSEYLRLTLPQQNPLRSLTCTEETFTLERGLVKISKRGGWVRTVSPHTQGTHLTTVHAMHFQFAFFSPPKLLDWYKKIHQRTDARSTQPPPLLSGSVITVYHISYFSSNNEFYGLFVSELLSLNYCDLAIVITHCCT